MRRFLVAVLALALAACNHYEPLSLHGAASMRVEVEVYKGPLTSPLQGQVGSLVGVISESIYRIDDWRYRAFKRLDDDCAGDKWHPSCDYLATSLLSANQYLSAACYATRLDGQLYFIVGQSVSLPIDTCSRNRITSDTVREKIIRHRSSDNQLDELQKIPDQRPREASVSSACKLSSGFEDRMLSCNLDDIAVNLENLASTLRGSARRNIEPFLSRVPFDAKNRTLIVEFADISAGFGEQIHSRVNALQRMAGYDDYDGSNVDENGRQRIRPPNNLPVGDYLRSASNTDYIQLYDWLMGIHVFDGRLTKLTNPSDRIRMAQRLTADTYWQKVNEVYASGQGDVGMAFIKDELGNWDLKSFDNEPAELLGAYRKVTDAALAAAAKLAAKAASGGGPAALLSARGAADFANQLAGGEVSPPPGVVGGVNLAALHDRVAARIAGQQERFAELEVRLTKERDAQDKALSDANELKGAKASAADAAEQKLTASSAERDRAASTVADSRGKLDIELNRDPAASAAAIHTAEQALLAAQVELRKQQGIVDSDQAALLAAKSAVTDAEAKARTAESKRDAAKARLDDLAKEAVEAVRGSLDDHLAVVAALQDGVASAAQPASKPVVPAPPVLPSIK